MRELWKLEFLLLYFTMEVGSKSSPYRPSRLILIEVRLLICFHCSLKDLCVLLPSSTLAAFAEYNHSLMSETLPMYKLLVQINGVTSLPDIRFGWQG